MNGADGLIRPRAGGLPLEAVKLSIQPAITGEAYRPDLVELPPALAQQVGFLKPACFPKDRFVHDCPYGTTKRPTTCMLTEP